MKTKKDEWIDELDYHQSSGANQAERVLLSALIMISYDAYHAKESLHNLLCQIGREDLNFILKSFAEKEDTTPSKTSVVHSILSSCIVMVHHWEQSYYYDGLDLLEETLLFYLDNPGLNIPDKGEVKSTVEGEVEAMDEEPEFGSEVSNTNELNHLNQYEKPIHFLDLSRFPNALFILVGIIISVFIILPV